MDRKLVVLVVARQPAVRRLAKAALKPAGFLVAESDDDEALLDLLANLRPDVLILEAPEPPEATYEAVRRLRGWVATPVILMSPLATPTRVAPALDAGADDYIARPFDSAELAARVRSLVRRRGGRLRTGLRRIDQAIVDLETRCISRGGRSIRLARPEWAILSLLLANEGRPIFHDELLTAAFVPDSRDDASTLRLTIGRLRRKLGLRAWDEGQIRTVRGVGYAFDPKHSMPRLRSRAVT
jgi:two-component system, OmpR family, KDP operon response regulator KdpE